jgi:hypothetical protein
VALLGFGDLVPLLQAVYNVTFGSQPWDGDTPGHAAMRAAAEANGQGPNSAYLAGWTWQYPMKALLEQAIASGDLTRANVLAIATELSDIDYQGILPTRSYAGSANDNVERSSLVAGVDPASSDGLAPRSDAFVSPLVAEFPLDGPCFTG